MNVIDSPRETRTKLASRLSRRFLLRAAVVLVVGWALATWALLGGHPRIVFFALPLAVSMTVYLFAHLLPWPWVRDWLADGAMITTLLAVEVYQSDGSHGAWRAAIVFATLTAIVWSAAVLVRRRLHGDFWRWN